MGKVFLGTSDYANNRIFKKAETLVEEIPFHLSVFLQRPHSVKDLVRLGYSLEGQIHLISLKKTDLFHKFIPVQTKFEQTNLRAKFEQN